MCLPAAFMAVASAGMSAVGGIMQANAQSAAMQQQAKQYSLQAEMQARQSNLEQMGGQYEARRKQEQIAGLADVQRGQFAAAGVSMDGTPTDVVLGSAQEGALDLAAIKFGTDIKSSNLNFQAKISGANSKMSEQAADIAKTTGYFNAISPIIGAFGGGGATGGAIPSLFSTPASNPFSVTSLGLKF